MKEIAYYSITTIAVLICTFLLINKIKKNRIKRKILQDTGNDYKNIARNFALSYSKSKELYKSLIIKVHPDKIDESKKIEAQELSKKLTTSKKDYQKLKELEKEIESFIKS